MKSPSSMTTTIDSDSELKRNYDGRGADRGSKPTSRSRSNEPLVSPIEAQSNSTIESDLFFVNSDMLPCRFCGERYHITRLNQHQIRCQLDNNSTKQKQAKVESIVFVKVESFVCCLCNRGFACKKGLMDHEQTKVCEKRQLRQAANENEAKKPRKKHQKSAAQKLKESVKQAERERIAKEKQQSVNAVKWHERQIRSNTRQS